MKTHVTFLDCPADIGHEGAIACGLPAEVELRYTLGSAGGPVESARIRCPRGHWFNGTIASLTHVPAPAAGTSPTSRAATRHVVSPAGEKPR